MKTSNQTERNAPCPCGSGLKFKACCSGKTATVPSLLRSPYVLLALALAVVATVFVVVRERKAESSDTAADATLGANPVPPAPPLSLSTSPSSPVTLTPVENPAGLMADAMNPPGALTPQPPGLVPEGKIWSPEHGHWHDVPGSLGQGAVPPGTPAAAPTFTPQPPGPVPEGKVWAPEHGHWHDAAPQAPPPPKP